MLLWDLTIWVLVDVTTTFQKEMLYFFFEISSINPEKNCSWSPTFVPFKLKTAQKCSELTSA